MNLHALRLFEQVAHYGSVTRAAEHLLISQPAVTAQVRNLEKELGLTLLEPRGRGILLTEAGHKLALHAQRLFAMEQEIETELQYYRQGKTGKLTIAATYLPANFLLPLKIAEYRISYPDVNIQLVTLNSSEAFEQLIGYKVDVAVIGGGGIRPTGMIGTSWIQDELWFIAAATHPYANKEITLQQVLLEPFVMREAGSSARERLKAQCHLHNFAEPEVALEVNGQNEMVQAVIAGCGMMLASALEVQHYINQGVLARVHVIDVNLPNTVEVFTRENDYRSPTLGRFLENII